MVGDRRVWVSCVGVDTLEKFEYALLAAVAGRQHSAHAGQAAISWLKEIEAQGPTLVVLDNFETPWDAPGIRTNVTSILESLDALPHLSLFVTMRAREAPCHNLHWQLRIADAVEDDIAKSIYLAERRPEDATQSSAKEDAALTELLKMVGNHPLAITLLAASARKEDAIPSTMLDQYKNLGTSMLGPSGNNQHDNMDLCVQVSIDRLTGRFKDDAKHL